MSTTTMVLPAPRIQFERRSSKWEREFEAFQRLLPDLLETHRGQFVLIHNGAVAAAGSDDLELALNFFAKNGNVPVHVGLVTETPKPTVRIPHYHELKQPGPAQ